VKSSKPLEINEIQAVLFLMIPRNLRKNPILRRINRHLFNGLEKIVSI